MRSCAALATIAGFAVCESLGGAADVQMEAYTERNETKWEFSLSTFTYLAQHARDYVNPSFTADYDRLHLEARYNYEALKTGSVWTGYNFPGFCIGKDLEVNVTPMLGGVFGDITGVAPGYSIEVSYKKFIKASTKENIFSMPETIPAISSTVGRSSVRRCQRQIASEPVLWSNARRPRAIPTSGADRSSVSNTNAKTKMLI
ncbi:MAG: hypothetical protein DMF26_00695 [Verrucomicrobia bacterium]|nr:MAG: hypothetical protein DMF26_00695 [Verrucomicrobiota bacterium]